MESLYQLKGVVQPYSWGGNQFIPDLLGEANAAKGPYAEYWLGAHPKAPSRLLNGSETTLDNVIESSPAEILGESVQQQFGTLPYLLKVLDVRQMLSIQVHPSIDAAKIGFAEEDQKGIPLTASNRNYKDQNHKPELMAALSDFWLLHGFKTEEGIRKIFATVPAFSFLQEAFEKNSYRGLYETVMMLSQERVDEVLEPLMDKMLPLYLDGRLEKPDAHFWAARAVQTFCSNGHYDRGIFSIYFFNLLHLREGEGIYQPAGLPHAYLEGQNVEIMANSDNVLRAGLTDKHVDVPELMKHVKFEPTVPAIIPSREEMVQVYQTPAAEFELTRLQLSEPAFLAAETATIFFVYEGEVEFIAGTQTLSLKRGEAALAIAGSKVELKPNDCTAVVFAAATPVSKK